jgi:hypothetical protein
MPIGRRVEIVSVTALMSPSIADISAQTGWTIALVTAASGDPLGTERLVRLPANAEIGAVVEIYRNTVVASTIEVLPPSGESFFNPATHLMLTSNHGGVFFRKVEADKWGWIKSNVASP